MSDIYFNTVVAAILNFISDNTIFSVTRTGFVEVSQTERKVTLVGFDHDHCKKSIPIGASKADMDLLNSTAGAHLNDSILIQGDDIYLLSIKQYHNFGRSLHEATSNHSGKNYTHVCRIGYLNEVHLY